MYLIVNKEAKAAFILYWVIIGYLQRTDRGLFERTVI